MGLFTLEHSKLGYQADFVLYGAACVLLAGWLVFVDSNEGILQDMSLALAGLAAWTVIEYLLHRFVLHGPQPFRRWHAEHHRRPAALIGTPTLASAGLIGLFVFLPVGLLGGWSHAVGFTLGVTSGYLAYSVTHHALHHWHGHGAWFMARRRSHARHHGAGRPGSYGVTTAFWDHVFGSVAPASVNARRAQNGGVAALPSVAPPRSNGTDGPSAGSGRLK